MKNALITGANKGIGFETATQLAKLGYFVFLGSRASLEAGRNKEIKNIRNKQCGLS